MFPYQDVKEYRDKMVEQLKDSFSVGEMKKSGTLILQYCYVGASQMKHS